MGVSKPNPLPSLLDGSRSSGNSVASTTHGTSTCSAGTSSSSSCRIRSRYFHRLGLLVTPPTATSLHGSSNDGRSRITGPSRRQKPLQSILLRKSSSNESFPNLTRCNSTLSTGSSSIMSSVTPSTSPRRRRDRTGVSFDEMVTIHTVPSLLDVFATPEERATVWISSTEAKVMIARNVYEFEMEGWDWRQAVEDEDFVVMEDDTEPVHPAHACHTTSSYHNNNNNNNDYLANHDQVPKSSPCFVTTAQQQFCKVLLAQRQAQYQKYNSKPKTPYGSYNPRHQYQPQLSSVDCR